MSVKKIILIEPFNHSEIIYRWLPFFAIVADEVECWVSTPRIMMDAPEGLKTTKTIKWSWPSNDTTIKKWLSVKCTQLTSGHKVIWLTSGLRYDWLSIVPGEIDFWLVVHNLQSFLKPELAFPLSLGKVKSLLKYLITNQPYFRRRLIRRKPFLLLPTDEMLAFATSQGYSGHKLGVLPFACQIEQAIPSWHDTIIIPGAIDKKRREYDTIFAAIQQLLKGRYKPVKLVFLGKSNDLKLEKKWKTLMNNNPLLNVEFFSQSVSQQDYDHHLKHANCLILPLRKKLSVGPFIETIGQTKVSGGFFDAIYFGLPILVPETIFGKKAFPNKFMVSYENSNDCAIGIEKILSSPEKKYELNTEGRDRMLEKIRATFFGGNK